MGEEGHWGGVGNYLEKGRGQSTCTSGVVEREKERGDLRQIVYLWIGIAIGPTQYNSNVPSSELVTALASCFHAWVTHTPLVQTLFFSSPFSAGCVIYRTVIPVALNGKVCRVYCC